MTEKSENVTKVQKQLRAVTSIPMSASIDEIIRAIQILSDNGGKARMNTIGNSFGTNRAQKVLFSTAINAGTAFVLVEPHKGRAPYILSEHGKKFLSMNQDQQKAFLKSKFLKFEGYRTILVAMKNSAEKSLKKQTITDMWLQVKDNTKKHTRKNYTKTFASVGEWCGALIDTGQSCSLKPEAKKTLEQILKGEDVPVIAGTIPSGTTTTIPSTSVTVSLLVSKCPHCGKTDIDIENEELLQTLSANGTHTLIIKNTYYCRGCSRIFSRIEQRQVKVGD